MNDMNFTAVSVKKYHRPKFAPHTFFVFIAD